MNVLGLHLDPVGLAAASIFLALVLVPEILRLVRRRRARTRARADGAVFMKRSAGGRPPLNAADVDDLIRWQTDHTLACAYVVVGDAPPVADVASRLGGGAWLPAGQDWPVGRNGRAMIFVAQVNFADVPPLPDYPDHGLLLFFISDDDVWGINFDDLEKSDARVIHVPDPGAPGRILRRPGPPAETSPFHDEDVKTHGRAVHFLASTMKPGRDDWRIEEPWPGWRARGGEARFGELLETPVDPEEGIYVGGHPCFTQTDPRGRGGGQDFDRVLLQVGSDDAFMWGDVGEASFLIRRADLLARNFSSILFTWDCH